MPNGDVKWSVFLGVLSHKVSAVRKQEINNSDVASLGSHMDDCRASRNHRDLHGCNDVFLAIKEVL